MPRLQTKPAVHDPELVCETILKNKDIVGFVLLY